LYAKFRRRSSGTAPSAHELNERSGSRGVDRRKAPGRNGLIRERDVDKLHALSPRSGRLRNLTDPCELADRCSTRTASGMSHRCDLARYAIDAAGNLGKARSVRGADGAVPGRTERSVQRQRGWDGDTS